MIISYIKPNTSESILNSFTDFILSHFKNSDVRIRLTNHNNFVVVNGETTSKQVLNLVELKNTFFETYYTDSFIKNRFNIIDIIEYNKNIYTRDIFHYTYYNSIRPIYHPEIVKFVEDPLKMTEYYTKISYNSKLIFKLDTKDLSVGDNYQYYDSLSTSSSFPHGYTSNIGRTAFYYGEYVCNHLFNYLNVNEIHLKMNFNKNSEEDDFDIQLFCNSIYDSEKIQSLVLDVFDFNLKKFEEEYLKNYNYLLDSSDPLGKKPWLVKDKLRDILIF